MAATMCSRRFIYRICMFRLQAKSSGYSTVAVPTRIEDNESDLYPPIRPKWPAGKWGGMTRRQAWHWHSRRRELSKLNTVNCRIKEVTAREMKMWRYRILEDYPRCSSYQQYATKTHVIKGLPNHVYDTVEVDKISEIIRPAVIETILFENNSTHRSKILSKTAPWLKDEYYSWIMLKNLLNNMTNYLSIDFPHLQNSQIDEDVRVEAFWDRHGYQRYKVPRYKDQDEKHLEVVDDSRLQANYVANFVVRSEEPLPEFLSRDDELCQTGAYPTLDYQPSTYGQMQFPVSKKPTVVAGHWPGDPCEFGLVTINTMNRADKVGEKFGVDEQERCLVGMGMNTSFVRLVAEAHYQGFNTCMDVTYPFTTQTILSDGQRFTFFAYQLNTLELWKDDDGNPLRNICWHSDTMKLYDGVEDGEVKGFNDDTLKHILRCLLLKPGRPGLELRPTLPGDMSPKYDTAHINDKVMKVKVKTEETYV